VPPVALNEPEYAVPIVPEGRTDVITFNDEAATSIVILTDLLCAGLPESETVAVKRAATLTAGVPEITPVLAARLRPDGKLPAPIDQLYGAVPPFACKVAVYAEPLVAGPKPGVEIVKGAIWAAATDIVRLTVAFFTGEPESTTVMPIA
jgi:hypothetical protein